jgi:hypothetical protein
MAEGHFSPLGRYDDSQPTDTTTDTMHTVRLLGVPVRVLEASRRHHDELMHEFALLAVQENVRDDVPKRMVELIDTLGRQYAGANEEPNAQVDAAFERGDVTIDLTYEVAHHVVEAADRLAKLMDEADEFCEREEMLTLQRPQVEKDFAHWYLEEFRRQIAGEPPRPWDGPLEA